MNIEGGNIESGSNEGRNVEEKSGELPFTGDSDQYPQMMYRNSYEFCPRCNAELIYQKGFNPKVQNWVCRGCGQMLINPEADNESDIVWICDGCGETLNAQEGFDEKCGAWKCRACGYENIIDESRVFESEEDYIAYQANPLNGMAEEDVRALQKYTDIEFIQNHENVVLVRNDETGELFVKKILSFFDLDVYEYLKSNPVANMPRIIELYKAKNYLFVIEEYIAGRNIEEILEERLFSEKEAIEIAGQVCRVARCLHRMNEPIIHRDIKPSNIIIGDDGKVYLLDVNAAKWLKDGEKEDTRLMGTQYYAAPEQYGFGYSASSEKTDIYAIGMLLNKMVTGLFPKEKKAEGSLWPVIEKCISYEFEKRYSDDELIDVLRGLEES